MDKNRVYFHITPCVSEGVPLGCIIMSNEKECTFPKSVEMLVTCSEESHLLKVVPSVITDDGDLKV